MAETVPTVSLEDILQRAGRHINFMKLDCVTSEYNFLFMKNLDGIDFIAGDVAIFLFVSRYECHIPRGVQH